MNLIELRDVVAVYGGFPALAGADLAVAPGEIVVVRGANGAGKSTLIRVCAGLMAVERGTVSVAGVDVVADPEGVRRHVGVLGHANGLYGDPTVRENVQFWADCVGATSTESDAALNSLGLSGRLADQQARKLSAGQRRRTAFACMVVRRPLVWLLDEPHAAVDTAGCDLIDATLRQAVSSGATVLLASHEIERTTELADRTVMLEGGRVIESTGQ